MLQMVCCSLGQARTNCGNKGEYLPSRFSLRFKEKDKLLLEKYRSVWLGGEFHHDDGIIRWKGSYGQPVAISALGCQDFTSPVAMAQR